MNMFILILGPGTIALGPVFITCVPEFSLLKCLNSGHIRSGCRDNGTVVSGQLIAEPSQGSGHRHVWYMALAITWSLQLEPQVTHHSALCIIGRFAGPHSRLPSNSWHRPVQPLVLYTILCLCCSYQTIEKQPI